MCRILISFSFCLIFLNSICSQTVKIGEQVWMNKNLDVTHFRNGDTIIESQNIEEWYQALRDKKPAWCYYEFKDENGKRDGKIYNVYALIDERGLAPSGFHISSKNEWLILYQFIRDEPSTKDYQIGYAKLRLTQIKVTEIIEEKKAGYDEETWVKCSNCSYWTQKQKENNPCSKCKNNGGKYVKTGKHIPSKIVKKEVVTNVGWDGSNDYNFNLFAYNSSFRVALNRKLYGLYATFNT